MPIQIISASYERPLARPSILERDGMFFGVEASSHNMPVSNMIGDIQISKSRGLVFHSGAIDCSTDSCVVKCQTYEPAIRRLNDKSPYVIDETDIEKLSIYGEDWLTLKTRVAGHVSISFGNVELKELIVEKPHCEIEPIMTYACTSCLEMPRVVFSSNNLVKEGMMDYSSNCTWNMPQIGCNIEMVEFKQISNEKYCSTYIPMLNQTLSISFEFEYRGTLIGTKTIKTETTYDLVTNIMSDPSFYMTLCGSSSSFLMLTAASTILIKLTRVGVMAFGSKEVQNA